MLSRVSLIMAQTDLLTGSLKEMSLKWDYSHISDPCDIRTLLVRCFSRVYLCPVLCPDPSLFGLNGLLSLRVQVRCSACQSHRRWRVFISSGWQTPRQTNWQVDCESPTMENAVKHKITGVFFLCMCRILPVTNCTEYSALLCVPEAKLTFSWPLTKINAVT